MRILFVCEAVTLAHLTRSFSLAKQLEKSNDIEIHIASSYCKKVLRAEPFSIPRHIVLHEIESISQDKFLTCLRNGLWPYNKKILTAYIKEERRLLHHIKPQLVISDFRLSLQTTCELLGFPFYGLVNAYWLKAIHQENIPVPYYRGLHLLPLPLAQKIFSFLTPYALNNALGHINTLRSEFNLSHFKSFEEYFCFGKQGLYPDSLLLHRNQQLDAQIKSRFIGPVLWTPGRHDATPAITMCKTSDKIYSIFVSMGSSGSHHMLQSILKALDSKDIQINVSLANKEKPFYEHKNISWHNFLPLDVACTAADLVICNGGSPTMYQALASGTPVIGIPSNLDQFLCMQSLEHLTSIKMIRADRMRIRELRTTVLSMLQNQEILRYAHNLASALGEEKFAPGFKNIVKQCGAFQLDIAS